MTQPRLNVLGSSPSVAGPTASVSMATPPHHQRTLPASANPGYHADKTAGIRKDKSLWEYDCHNELYHVLESEHIDRCVYK